LWVSPVGCVVDTSLRVQVLAATELGTSTGIPVGAPCRGERGSYI
jgi:hypothetical protein